MSNVVYRIDPEGRLVSVDSGWHTAARESGSELPPGRVIGRRLSEFMTDRTVIHLCETVVARARARGSFRYPFRCDTPGARRDCEMIVSAQPDEHVEFVSRVLAVSRRPAIEWLQPDAPRGPEFLRMCSWCHAVAESGAAWRPLEDVFDLLARFDPRALPQITHGICEPCSDKMLRLLRP